jgi:DNA-binding CsgD family transcriptional regulator
MAKTTSELLPGVIGSIYDATLDRTLWANVLPSIAAIFDSQQVAFNVLNGGGSEVQFIAAHGLGSEDFKLFRAFAATTDAPQWWQTAPADQPSLRSAISPDREFSRTAYYNEVIRPSGSFYALLAPVMRGPHNHVDLIVARGAGSKDYDARHLAAMRLLMPHARRAVEIGRRLATGQSALSSLSHLPFGVMFVDPHFRVVNMNEAAEAMVMRPHGPLRVRSGALSIADAESRAALQQLVADVCHAPDGFPGAGGDVLIRVRPGNHAGSNIVVSVTPSLDPSFHGIPFARGAVLFVREISLELPAGFAEQLRTVFDLTPKEAALAASLASGMTLKQAAEDARIRINTARSYLDNIFVKTATRQQSQLVALLRSAQSIVRPSVK